MYSTPNLTPGLRSHRYIYNPAVAGVIPCGILSDYFLRVDRVIYLGRTIGNFVYNFTGAAECSNTTGAVNDFGGFLMAYSQVNRNIGDIVNLNTDPDILMYNDLTSNLAAFTFDSMDGTGRVILAALDAPCYLIYGVGAIIGAGGIIGNVQAQARNIRLYAEIAGCY